MRQNLNTTILVSTTLILFLGMNSVCAATPQDKVSYKEKINTIRSAKSFYEQAKLVKETDPQKAIILAEDALSVLTPDNEQLSDSILELMGSLNSDMGMHQRALDYYQRCLESSLIKSNKTHKANILRAIGISYYQMGIYEKALEAFSKTLVIGQEINNSDIIAKAYNNMGLTYMESFEFESAREFFQKAATIFKKAGNGEKMGYAMLNIGNSFFNQNNNDKALEYYLKVYQIADTENNRKLLALSAQNLALISEFKKDKDEALRYCLKALSIYRELNDQQSVAVMLSNTGTLLADWGKPTQAEPYLQEALNISLQLESLPTLEKCYLSLASLYEQKKDFHKAFDYLNKGKILTDSLYNSDRNSLLLNMQTKYQVAEKEKENKLLRFTLLVSIPLGTLLLIVILIAFLIKRRANRLLAEKNKQIEIQNKRLEEVNDTKDLFFSILGHDLKNSLGGFVTFSQLLSAHGDSFSEEEKHKFFVEMRGMAENLYTLMENLLDWARTQTGALKVTTSTIDIADLISYSEEPHRSLIKKKRIEVALSLDASLQIISDRNLLAIILRNLIGNAVKYTRSEGKIEIVARELDNTIEFAVTDHGVGIPEEVLGKLFRVGNKYRTEGTENEPGTGLGLILCREFTQMLGGTITVVSKLGKGSTFTLTLPAKFQLPE